MAGPRRGRPDGASHRRRASGLIGELPLPLGPVPVALCQRYRPDFYYPDIEVWHEHWALGRDGRPPASFQGYAEDMAWKRRVHAEHGTTLVESTWAEVVFGDGLTKLEDGLTRLGLSFDWDPERP